MEFYGLIGGKLGHSVSPEIHNTLFKELNIEGAYKLCEMEKESLKNLKTSIITLGIKGMNVTIPYKEEIMKELDYISEEAMKIGAVNTIHNKNGKLIGYNTDYYGFGKLLEKNNIEVKDKIHVILGAGGGAKAVYYYLKDNGAKDIFIVSRDKYKSFCDGKVIDYSELQYIKGDTLINTTPIGMYPKIDESPVEDNVVNNFEAIVDIVYNPEETLIMKKGKALGKKTCNGLYMLVGQGIKAEEIWNDIKVPEEVSNKIYEYLKGK